MSNSDFSREFCDLINTFNFHSYAFKILWSALVVIFNDYIAAVGMFGRSLSL